MLELKQLCKEDCSKIPSENHAGLITSYRKRLVEVIAPKGGWTSYYIQGFTYFFHQHCECLMDVYISEV